MEDDQTAATDRAPSGSAQRTRRRRRSRSRSSLSGVSDVYTAVSNDPDSTHEQLKDDNHSHVCSLSLFSVSVSLCLSVSSERYDLPRFSWLFETEIALLFRQHRDTSVALPAEST